MSNYKDNYKESFKPTVKITNIAQFKKANPTLRVKGLRVDESFDPNQEQVQKYLDRGWDLVVSTDTVDQAYDSTKSNAKEQDYKPVPMVKKGRGNAQFCYVSISEERYQQNKTEDAKREHQRFLNSTRGRKAERTGNSLKITDAIVDPNDVNSNFEGE